MSEAALPIQYLLGCTTDVIDLRHLVLREGLPRESAMFPGDDAATTRHYIARLNGRTVCCATFHLNEWEGAPAWQLRGMATTAELRGKGIGRRLLMFAEPDLMQVGPIRRLWCNARVPASRFYQSLGWTIASDAFEIPTAGPHYRMTKLLKEVKAG